MRSPITGQCRLRRKQHRGAATGLSGNHALPPSSRSSQGSSSNTPSGGPDEQGGQFSTGDRGSVFTRWRHDYCMMRTTFSKNVGRPVGGVVHGGARRVDELQLGPTAERIRFRAGVVGWDRDLPRRHPCPIGRCGTSLRARGHARRSTDGTSFTWKSTARSGNSSATTNDMNPNPPPQSSTEMAVVAPRRLACRPCTRIRGQRSGGTAETAVPIVASVERRCRTAPRSPWRNSGSLRAVGADDAGGVPARPVVVDPLLADVLPIRGLPRHVWSSATPRRRDDGGVIWWSTARAFMPCDGNASASGR